MLKLPEKRGGGYGNHSKNADICMFVLAVYNVR